MRTLFLRIFLWFWLVTALVIATLVGLSPYWTRSHPALERWEAVSLEHLTGWLDRAVERGAVDHEPEPRGEGERRRGGPRHGKVFVFTSDGESLREGPVPPDIREVVNEVVATGQPASRREGFHLVVARPAEAADGSGRIIALGAPTRDPPRPWELLSARSHLLRLGVVVLIVGVLCWWLSRYLTSPLRVLRAAVGRLASGDLSARAGRRVVARRDEIGQLGRDFDTMAGRLEDLVGAQRRLLSDVSHELRSPLARLNVAVELARSREGAAAEEALDRVERESARLDELIGQLLLLERLQARDRAERGDQVALDELLLHVVEDAAFEARARGVEVRAGTVETCTILGSPSLLRSALENVVRNAARWSDDGSEVEVRLEVREGEVVIAVEDRGPGIPEEDLPHVFEPFYRAEHARDRRRGGAGLGLAIAARAVESHGGSIRPSNREGGGLAVTITLPIDGD